MPAPEAGALWPESGEAGGRPRIYPPPAEVPCPVCGKTFLAKSASSHGRGQVQRTCSRACGQLLRFPGSSPRARVRACEICGNSYRASYADQRTCGRSCGAILRFGPPQPKPKPEKPPRSCADCGGELPTPRASRCMVCVQERRKQERKRAWQKERAAKRRWHAGACAECGASFVSDRAGRFCSASCSLRHERHTAKARRRARKREAYVADVWRQKIFERDRWRCQVPECQFPRRIVARAKQVPHPRAPVLDHIVPLAAGGTHEPANVQCAHFLCNSVKSARGGGEQLLLIG